MKSYVRYATLVAKLVAWKAVEVAACKASRRARLVVVEANASAQGCIDPLTPILDELEALHARLFGAE